MKFVPDARFRPTAVEKRDAQRLEVAQELLLSRGLSNLRRLVADWWRRKDDLAAERLLLSSVPADVSDCLRPLIDGEKQAPESALHDAVAVEFGAGLALALAAGAQANVQLERAQPLLRGLAWSSFQVTFADSVKGDVAWETVLRESVPSSADQWFSRPWLRDYEREGLREEERDWAKDPSVERLFAPTQGDIGGIDDRAVFRLQLLFSAAPNVALEAICRAGSPRVMHICAEYIGLYRNPSAILGLIPSASTLGAGLLLSQSTEHCERLLAHLDGIGRTYGVSDAERASAERDREDAIDRQLPKFYQQLSAAALPRADHKRLLRGWLGQVASRLLPSDKESPQHATASTALGAIARELANHGRVWHAASVAEPGLAELTALATLEAARSDAQHEPVLRLWKALLVAEHSTLRHGTQFLYSRLAGLMSLGPDPEAAWQRLRTELEPVRRRRLVRLRHEPDPFRGLAWVGVYIACGFADSHRRRAMFEAVFQTAMLRFLTEPGTPADPLPGEILAAAAQVYDDDALAIGRLLAAIADEPEVLGTAAHAMVMHGTKQLVIRAAFESAQLDLARARQAHERT